MRDLVRRRIAAGRSPARSARWLIQRYGTWISYKPTDRARGVAAVARAAGAAARRRLADPPPYPRKGEALMGWASCCC